MSVIGLRAKKIPRVLNILNHPMHIIMLFGSKFRVDNINRAMFFYLNYDVLGLCS